MLLRLLFFNFVHLYLNTAVIINITAKYMYVAPKNYEDAWCTCTVSSIAVVTIAATSIFKDFFIFQVTLKSVYKNLAAKIILAMSSRGLLYHNDAAFRRYNVLA